MVDSYDRKSIDDSSGYPYSSAKHALHTMLADEQLQGVPLLVLANKQDLPNALSVDEVEDRLALNDINDRDWKIMGSCAITGEGLYEGLDWILSAEYAEPQLFPDVKGGRKQRKEKSTSSSVKSFFSRFARKK